MPVWHTNVEPSCARIIVVMSPGLTTNPTSFLAGIGTGGLMPATWESTPNVRGHTQPPVAMPTCLGSMTDTVSQAVLFPLGLQLLSNYHLLLRGRQALLCLLLLRANCHLRPFPEEVAGVFHRRPSTAQSGTMTQASSSALVDSASPHRIVIGGRGSWTTCVKPAPARMPARYPPQAIRTTPRAFTRTSPVPA